MIVALILTAIVSSMAFFIWSYFNRQQNSFIQRQSEYRDFLMLQTALLNDCSTSQFIQIENDSTVIFYWNENASVIYAFSENTIVRNSISVNDSFDIHLSDKFFQLNSEQPELVEDLFIECKIGSKKYQSIHRKVYPAADLLDYEEKYED